MVTLIPRWERDLAPAVVEHFTRQGYAVGEEVYFNGRIADVLATRDGEVVAIELKLKDWRGALVQAKAYQVGCHRTYVGLPLVVAVDMLRRTGARKVLAETGCGVLGINYPERDVRVLVQSRESARRLDFLSDGLSGAHAHDSA